MQKKSNFDLTFSFAFETLIDNLFNSALTVFTTLIYFANLDAV